MSVRTIDGDYVAYCDRCGSNDRTVQRRLEEALYEFKDRGWHVTPTTCMCPHCMRLFG